MVMYMVMYISADIIDIAATHIHIHYGLRWWWRINCRHRGLLNRTASFSTICSLCKTSSADSLSRSRSMRRSSSFSAFTSSYLAFHWHGHSFLQKWLNDGSRADTNKHTFFQSSVHGSLIVHCGERFLDLHTHHVTHDAFISDTNQHHSRLLAALV